MSKRDPWPTHPDGRPKRMGELTLEEQKHQVHGALHKLAKEQGWEVAASASIDDIRRVQQAEFNAAARAAGDPVPLRAQLAEQHGPDNVWDTDEMRRDFEVLTFLAPYVTVRRRADGVEGTLQFCHNPRMYFAFEPA